MTIVNAINEGADLYNNELPDPSKQKLGLAADFFQNDWPALKNEITVLHWQQWMKNCQKSKQP